MFTNDKKAKYLVTGVIYSNKSVITYAKMIATRAYNHYYCNLTLVRLPQNMERNPLVFHQSISPQKKLLEFSSH
jgi:hypothetical protein